MGAGGLAICRLSFCSQAERASARCAVGQTRLDIAGRARRSIREAVAVRPLTGGGRRASRAGRGDGGPRSLAVFSDLIRPRPGIFQRGEQPVRPRDASACRFRVPFRPRGGFGRRIAGLADRCTGNSRKAHWLVPRGQSPNHSGMMRRAQARFSGDSRPGARLPLRAARRLASRRKNGSQGEMV